MQILTLEDEETAEGRDLTFRRENGAEILELEEQSTDLVEDELKRQSKLEVLPEVDEQNDDEELIRSELASAEQGT